MALLQLQHVQKTFKQGPETLVVLADLNFSIEKGEVVSIVGPSGSGKSTFLTIAGLLENLTSGKVYFNGIDCSNISDGTRTKIRREGIGFIYQFHHLLPEFTALENVILPKMLCNYSESSAKKAAMEALESLGLGDRVHHLPSELSGGERQRVSIARSLINNPSLVLADEPTGNLDHLNAEYVTELIIHQAKLRNTSAIIVTHNVELASKTDKILSIRDGRIAEDLL